MAVQRRRSRWDRPPPPHDWRWAVGNVGKVLIAVGLLTFGFVGYQLWGTGIEYAQAQDELDREFEDLLARAATTTSTTTASPPTTSQPATTVSGATAPPPSAPPTTAPGPPTTAAPPPATVAPFTFADGDVVARIEIPAIGVDSKVVQGVSTADLKRGPGHFPATPMPGQLGNAAIAGHRTTYGEPFADLDRVQVGDEIIVTTVEGRFVYRATGSEIVAPSASEVVATTDPEVATLTLTTCHPRYTARQRLVLFADLDLVASSEPRPAVIPDEPVPATLPGGPPTTLPPSTSAGVAAPSPTVSETEVPTTVASATATTLPPPAGEVPEETADAFDQGWFSDSGAFGQVALWGIVLSAIAVGAYLLSRAVRRDWVGALAGIVPFVVVLYFFFQNVNRLLPAAL